MFAKIAPEKLITAILAGAYFLGCAWAPESWHFIDGADLVIHECGHPLFGLAGEFMGIAGGSITQLLAPAAIAIYFVTRREYFSAAIVAMWLGQSLLNVSIYAGDAIAMELPLVGGEDVIHDWNWLLTHLGWLSHTAAIAAGCRWCGRIVIALAALWALTAARRDPTGAEAA